MHAREGESLGRQRFAKGHGVRIEREKVFSSTQLYLNHLDSDLIYNSFAIVASNLQGHFHPSKSCWKSVRYGQIVFICLLHL